MQRLLNPTISWTPIKYQEPSVDGGGRDREIMESKPIKASETTVETAMEKI